MNRKYLFFSAELKLKKITLRNPNKKKKENKKKMASSEIRLISNILAAIIPPLVLFLTYHYTHDALIILFCLTIIYVLIPLIYDNFIYNLRWEKKYGPEVSNLQQTIGAGVGTLLGGFLLSSLIWVLSYIINIYVIEKEVTPFPYINYAFPRFLYYFLVTIFGVFIVPITEELFYRSFLAADGGISGIVSVISYVALNHIKFSFIYPEEKWMIFVLDILFAIIGGFLNIMGVRSILQSSGFSIGLTLGWVLRILILGSGSRPFPEPVIFQFYDYLNVWN